MPQWCFTATGVPFPLSEEDTNAFDVGTESSDDELPALDEDVADLCDVEVVTDVEAAVDPPLAADLVVEPVESDEAADDEPVL